MEPIIIIALVVVWLIGIVTVYNLGYSRGECKAFDESIEILRITEKEHLKLVERVEQLTNRNNEE